MLRQATLTILLAILPSAGVDVPVWPVEGPLAMLLVLVVLPFVALSIWPCQRTMPFHLVIPPHA